MAPAMVLRHAACCSSSSQRVGAAGDELPAPSSDGTTRELLAIEDAVATVVLLDPPEPDEGGDGLVHPLPRRPDPPGELLLGDGERELVGVPRQLEEALGGTAGDVEEHRVGEGVVDAA